MTVQKAIKALYYFIGEKTKQHESLYALEKKFSQKDTFELAQLMRVNIESEIQVLNAIRGQLVTKCRHPKKMRDRTPDGQWYCMNCNMDL